MVNTAYFIAGNVIPYCFFVVVKQDLNGKVLSIDVKRIA